jgi:hypothetical protein
VRGGVMSVVSRFLEKFREDEVSKEDIGKDLGGGITLQDIWAEFSEYDKNNLKGKANILLKDDIVEVKFKYDFKIDYVDNSPESDVLKKPARKDIDIDIFSSVYLDSVDNEIIKSKKSILEKGIEGYLNDLIKQEIKDREPEEEPYDD